ncbi:MAG: hypothetical protein KAS32_26350, partial [Candidatus Peribacteraceae bacterium]|nr:hypothetical protein [Candidatus Peribacteraceae bacterium]
DILYDLKVKYSSKLEGIFVETKQYQLIRQFFFEKGVRVSKPVDIYPLIWKGEAGERGKLNRISMLIPYAHLGNIELVEGYTKPLEIEMLSFDGRKKKRLNTLDSFSYNALYLTESNICVTNKSIMNSVENMTVDEHFKKYVTDRTDEFEDYGDMFL